MYSNLFKCIKCNLFTEPVQYIYSADQELATLQEAFDKYQNFTCITFVERTNQVNYVSIQKTGGG